MSTELGQRAETLAAQFLQRRGLKIVERNWRTRWCEIDIVATANRTVHFIEVKHRRLANYGRGLEYITPDKSRRLRKAALAWMSEHADGRDYRIDVVELLGPLDAAEITYFPNVIIEA